MFSDAVLRILDANLNRAREALRVAEEHARFVCDDAELSAAFKGLRHDLRRIEGGLGMSSAERLAARDVSGDVGLDGKTESERQRGTTGDVARAALARAGEALRVISEYAKLSGGESGRMAGTATSGAAEFAERLRYGVYALEPRLVVRGARRARLVRARLYVLITAETCFGDWLATAEAALRGGADVLQLREKGLGDGELLARARRLRELTARHDALLIVNDRPDIARLAEADGVHVGQEDLGVSEARRAGGEGLLVGLSTHTPVQIEAAAPARPDYVAVGPVFASRTKPGGALAGLELVRAAAARLAEPATPIVAIGGITAATAGSVFAAGASCVCVCAAVAGAGDAESAARAIREAAGLIPNKNRI